MGTGTLIRVWKDNWLPKDKPSPASGPGSTAHPNLKSNELLIPGTGIWNMKKLEQLVKREESEIIQKIRPSLTNVFFIWIYSRNGEYDVKSGYHFQRNHDRQGHIKSV